jgi:uncharacterized BrkB/YihY/UPF0761 family membrane protein
MHKRKRILATILFGLTSNAFAAVVCDLVEGFKNHYTADVSLAGTLLCAVPALLMPVLYLLFYYLGPREVRGNKYASFALVAVMVVLSLGTQIWSYLQLATDAQAALAFLFLPIYASFIYVVFGFILVGGTLLTRRRT